MAKCARVLLLLFLVLCAVRPSRAVDGRFDLVGPRINVRVTRNGITLPIAEVPNLQPGDRIWLHPDLPPTQSVKYLLICAFLRGSTNPPPEEWFTRIETWDKHVREEGVFVTVPKEAQQAVLFLAPETGGDFSTLKSAVRGRPGIFVRASQDLAAAGFEQARIEKYLSDIRRVPPADANELQKHSDLLARTLALKPNEDCFKRSVDTQFTCLTQIGTQTLLDDGHGQSIASRLSTGPNSDLIAAASYTRLMGGGMYSAYVGAVVDLVRVMANLHTAQYQYIPAIAFPQADAMNLRLNTPPSFHNPKSVLVIGLPAVQPSPIPPLRPADANHIACLIEPSVTLPIEGAPLVFSTSLAHDLVLHLNVPDGAPAEPDIPLVADAYQGGLVLQRQPEHHVPLHNVLPAPGADKGNNKADKNAAKPAPAKPQPEPIRLTGTIQGRWGFDSFTGPTVPLQQLPGSDWQIASGDASDPETLIAGHNAQLLISSTGSACVHTITAQPRGSSTELNISFKPAPTPEHPNLLALTLPLEHAMTPGDLNISIQQYGQPKAEELAARTFSEPAHIEAVELHAADRTMLLTGQRLNEIERVTLGDLNFTPQATTASTDPNQPAETANTLRVALPANAPVPPTKVGDQLTARVTLNDGRTLTIPVTVSAARPSISLISKNATVPGAPVIALSNIDDLPLSAPLSFTLKSQQSFPRNVRIEIETVDGTLRAVLTLAPSGGLLLQDSHTVVASLDPLRAFGPNAFGALHVRAIFPVNGKKHGDADNAIQDEASSDWLPLGTLVRLPQLTLLQCPADTSQPCTLSGSNLFLIASISPDPHFSSPASVPDGYTGATLSVPRPLSPGTLFLKLRDDPNPVDSATVPIPPPPAPRRRPSVPPPDTKAADKPAADKPAENKTGENKTGENKSVIDNKSTSTDTKAAPDTTKSPDSQPASDAKPAAPADTPKPKKDAGHDN